MSIETSYGKAELALSSQICGAENLIPFAFQRVQGYDFQIEGPQLFYDPVIAPILAQNTMGQEYDETPRAPVYMFHALQDEVIPYSNATTLRDEWCANGASVDFVTYAEGGHFGTEILGFYAASQFIQSAFAGKAGGPCTSSVTNNNTIVADISELEPVFVNLLDDLAALGNQDENVAGNPGNLKNVPKTVS
jgi:hypothetical protein